LRPLRSRVLVSAGIKKSLTAKDAKKSRKERGKTDRQQLSQKW
jgi:hypothetical protein